MNCANHPERERAAFCQNCGKPLCSQCVRYSGTSILCEQCLAARNMSGYGGGYGYGAGEPGAGVAGPNPGLAALMGFIPGVGAMYNGQYGKGIVHLIVFAVLVTLANDVNGIFGLFVAGWIFYMAIEAHHTARARRDGTPLPNPFGLNDVAERFGFGRAWPGAGARGPATMGWTEPYAGPGAAGGRTPATGAAEAGGMGAAGAGGAGAGGAGAAGVVGTSMAPYVTPGAAAEGGWGAPQDYAREYAREYRPEYRPGAAQGYGQGAAQESRAEYRQEGAAAAEYDASAPAYRRLPMGAIWLIALGALFLVGNVGLFHGFFNRFFGPILLIGVGVFTFVRKMTFAGHGLENDGSDMYHWRLWRAVRAGFWPFLVGVVWLLDELGILSWGRSWPLFVIGAGLMVIFKEKFYGRSDAVWSYPAYPPSGYPPSGAYPASGPGRPGSGYGAGAGAGGTGPGAAGAGGAGAGEAGTETGAGADAGDREGRP